jgi:hypothetical protein
MESLGPEYLSLENLNIAELLFSFSKARILCLVDWYQLPGLQVYCQSNQLDFHIFSTNLSNQSDRFKIEGFCDTSLAQLAQLASLAVASS